MLWSSLSPVSSDCLCVMRLLRSRQRRCRGSCSWPFPNRYPQCACRSISLLLLRFWIRRRVPPRGVARLASLKRPAGFRQRVPLKSLCQRLRSPVRARTWLPQVQRSSIASSPCFPPDCRGAGKNLSAQREERRTTAARSTLARGHHRTIHGRRGRVKSRVNWIGVSVTFRHAAFIERWPFASGKGTLRHRCVDFRRRQLRCRRPPPRSRECRRPSRCSGSRTRLGSPSGQSRCAAR